MSIVVALVGALAVLLVYDGLTGAAGNRSRTLLGAADRLAAESGMSHLSGARLVAASVVSGVVTLIAIAGSTSSLVIALAFAAAATSAPFVIARSRRQRRLTRFREAWPDAIATLIAGVRSGISLPEACGSLAERGPKDLRSGFEAFARTYRASGSFHASLDRLRVELSDPIADRVVAALSIAHDVGGTHLVRVLRTLGDFVTQDLRVRKEIEARWSWTVTAARVAAAAPWIVLLLMSVRPEAASAYNSPTGVVVVLVGAGATVVGYRLMLRAARLPEERRLLG